MDRVSLIIDMLVASVMKNKRESDRLMANGKLDKLPTRDAATVRRLTDHNEMMMAICHQLHEAEDRTIRGIWGEKK